MSLAVGTRLGPYEVTGSLGAGGMGEVYRAHDLRLERDVALKVLPAEALGDATARARLLREARLASKLNHPHICTVHDVGEDHGQAYVAMELVEGQTLSELAAARARPAAQVCATARRWPTRWRTRTRGAWCTATSRARTWWSPRTAR